ncbi:hypothetical protein NFI96_025951 [Prochilodus magdalenae]|nr:hypothetical protein NFI96_025951 [Prochilodus magdalenae]
MLPTGHCPQDTAHRTLPTGHCSQEADHKTLPTGCCPQDVAHRTLPTGCCSQDAAHRTLLTGHCSQDTAHRTLLTGHCSQDTAHRTLLTGHCPQDTAHRTLLTGHCSQEAAHRTLPTGRCPQDTAHRTLLTGRCPQDTAHRTLLTGHCPQDTAHRTLPTGRCPQDAAHRTLLTGRCSQDAAHRTLPTGHCSQDAAHRTLLTGRCPQDAAHRTLFGLIVLLRQLELLSDWAAIRPKRHHPSETALHCNVWRGRVSYESGERQTYSLLTVKDDSDSSNKWGSTPQQNLGAESLRATENSTERLASGGWGETHSEHGSKNRLLEEAITDGLEIAVSPRSLHSELMCPICLDMLKNTMTTKECLHRFCADCIITALRSGNKECPTCRKKLVSKRSLRPDPNFDALISKIYPSRDEYEAHQERVLARISKHNNQQALSHSIEEGLKIQAMNRLQRGKKHQIENGSGAEDNGDSSHCSNASVHSNQEAGPSIKRTKTSDDSGLDMDNATENGGGDMAMDGASEIELVFRPHPTLMEKEDAAQTRYIKTSGNATVDHLSKYLAVRLALEELRKNGEASPINVEAASEKQYTIYIPTANNQFTVLNGSFSLELVSEKYWKVNKPMELYFAPTKEHK